MYHFFVDLPQIQGDVVTITGSDVNHIRNVLRMKAGEELAVGNGVDCREYCCRIEEFSGDCVICRVQSVREADTELPDFPRGISWNLSSRRRWNWGFMR